MRISSIPGTLLFVLLTFVGTSAAARSLRIEAAAIEAPQGSLAGLQIEARATPEGGSLQLAIQRLRIPRAAFDQAVSWHCALHREGDAQVCAGALALAGRASAGLSVRWSKQALVLDFQHDATTARLQWPLANGAPALEVRKLPADWLQPLLAENWQGGRLRAGQFDLDVHDVTAERAKLRYAARGLDARARDGSFGAVGVDAQGTLDVGWTGNDLHLDARVQLANGRLDVGVLHAQLPSQGIDVELEAAHGEAGLWRVDRLHWRDPEALEFAASAQFDPGALAPLRALSVSQARLVFPLAGTRYAHGVLAAHGWGGLVLSGELRGRVEVDAHGMSQLQLTSERLDLRDADRRLEVRGLRGGIDWRREGRGESRTLTWTHARWDKMTIDALRSRWQVRDGTAYSVGALDARLLGGHLAAREVALRLPETGEWLRGAFSLRDIGYETRDGAVGVAKAALDARLQLSGMPDAPRVRADATLRGGQYLLDSLYLDLPTTPIQAHLEARIEAGDWHVAAFEWNDPGVLELSAAGDVMASRWRQSSGRFDLHRVELDSALQRYAHSWLASRGYPQLTAQGQVRGAVAFAAGKVQAFSLSAQQVSIDDGAGRFRIRDLDGTLDWDSRGARPATTLGWRAVDIYKVPLGAAQTRWTSSADELRLAAPFSVEVLGGQLRLEKFIAQPASPRGDRYEASFAIVGVQLPRMSAAFGWPIFPGNLSGGIPEIEFVGDRIEFHGGLDLYLFDGHLGVSGMSLERPFGTAPALEADIHFENFDLEQVTSAFSFGGMSGRLFGTIGGLRLLDWSTVAFDAYLRTQGGGRMSYKAVDDITGISSGGPSLQTLALKLVNTFGFARLGVRCRLRDEVCTMGGIEPLPESQSTQNSLDSRGYAIVRGAGVPRIDIVGYRRQVDWPTLVRRLHEATQGQAPIIQ